MTVFFLLDNQVLPVGIIGYLQVAYGKLCTQVPAVAAENGIAQIFGVMNCFLCHSVRKLRGYVVHCCVIVV